MGFIEKYENTKKKKCGEKSRMWRKKQGVVKKVSGFHHMQ